MQGVTDVPLDGSSDVPRVKGVIGGRQGPRELSMLSASPPASISQRISENRRVQLVHDKAWRASEAIRVSMFALICLLRSVSGHLWDRLRAKPRGRTLQDWPARE